jgi:DNA-binding NtrC family response regulator
MAKVLVVEDDAATQDFLEIILSKDNHEVLKALNGESGLKLAVEENPDIILSDLMLPEPPADLELLAKLREAAPGVPIVVISGYPSSDRISKCEELGVTEFLTKPFEIPFVRDIVNRLISEPGNQTQE